MKFEIKSVQVQRILQTPGTSPLFPVTLMVTVVTQTSHKNMERQKDELCLTDRRWVDTIGNAQ